MLKNCILVFIVVLLLAGCAVNYSSVDFLRMNYTSTVKKGDFEFKYSYNAMQQMHNNRYMKYEVRNNIKIVALQITNNSTEAVTITNDNFKVMINGNGTNPLSPQAAQQQLKQGVIQYLLYSLLWLNIESDEDPEPEATIPIGIPISLINMLQAGGSNKRVLRDLTEYNPIGKTIGAGETIDCLMVLYNSNYSPLDFEIVKE